MRPTQLCRGRRHLVLGAALLAAGATLLWRALLLLRRTDSAFLKYILSLLGIRKAQRKNAWVGLSWDGWERAVLDGARHETSTLDSRFDEYTPPLKLWFQAFHPVGRPRATIVRMPSNEYLLMSTASLTCIRPSLGVCPWNHGEFNSLQPLLPRALRQVRVHRLCDGPPQSWSLHQRRGTSLLLHRRMGGSDRRPWCAPNARAHAHARLSCSASSRRATSWVPIPHAHSGFRWSREAA
jgi:hypothetical protein